MASTVGMWSILALGVSLAACSTKTEQAQTPAPAAAAPAAPIELPSCGIGTMVGPGGSACVAVGPNTVPEGFQRSPDDWGFRAINPFGNCPERFFSPIGSTICVAIDHQCPTTFAPAGATLVHDQAELVAALAASAPGATIALAGGTYASIVVDRDVHLIGLCPESVFLQGSGTNSHGIEVRGAHTVTLRSLTIRNTTYALWATGGATITAEQSRFTGNDVAAWIEHDATLKLSHSLIDAGDNKMADGVLVARGGHAELSDAELRNVHIGLQAFGDGSTAKGSQLVITDRSTELSPLVIASHGGDVQIERSLIFAQNSFIGGATATDPRETGTSPAKLRIASSEIMRVLPTDSGGFDVSDGSTLELVNVTFETRARVAISAESGAKVSLDHTVIRPVLPTDVANRGIGAGLVINDGVQLTVDHSVITGVVQSAIMASKGCHIRAVGSLIADVWEYSRTDLGKRYTSGQAISLSGDAALEMSDSALVNNAGAAIWMDRGGSASVKVERSVILNTRTPDRSTSVAGLLAWSGTVDLRSSLVHGIPGTALAFGDATGAVFDTTLSQSDVAFRLFGQSHTLATADVDQRPGAGEILTRANVLVETTTAETQEPLPLGDCRCEAAAGKGL